MADEENVERENQMREVELPPEMCGMGGGGGLGDIKQRVASQMLKAVQAQEKLLDAELDALSHLKKDDLQGIRRKRMVELKKRSKKMAEWRSKGHGTYSELGDEKEWFRESKENERTITVFYRNSHKESDKYTKILDRHMQVLAQKHIETRFLKINAEKCHFLAQRLNIVLLPTILCTKNNFTHDRIEGFDQLGGREDFTTQTLRARLGQKGNISYDPIVDNPINKGKKEIYTASKTNKLGAAIYKSKLAELGDDDDWDDISD